MTVTAHTYTKLSLTLANGLVDLTGDSLKMMLLDSYTVGSTQDTAQFVADVLAVATEASGTGYTAGGKSLASITFAEAGHVYTLDSADITWAASTITASFALLYDATPGSDITSPVIGYYDLGGDVSSAGGAFTLTINAAGLLTMTGA